MSTPANPLSNAPTATMSQLQPGISNPMGGAGTPPPPQQPAPQQTQQTQQAPNPQQAQAAHDQVVGRAFKALSGQSTQYAVDPKTGQMTQTPVQNKPGQFFKNIVAAALVGGAMGEEQNKQDGGTFLGGALSGGKAVVDKDQQQNQQRIQQAQEDFKNQITAQQNQRDEQANQRDNQEAQTKQELYRAQIASAQLTRAKEAMELGNEDHQTHVDYANQFSGARAALDAASLPYQTFNEADFDKFREAHPDYVGKYYPVPDDAKNMSYQAQPDGHVAWNTTYRVYDLKNNVPVTPAMLKQGKDLIDSGQFPELADTLKNKKELTPQQYVAFSEAAQKATAAAQSRKTASLSNEDLQSQIDERKATRISLLSKAGLDVQDTRAKKLSNDETELVNQSELALANGGFNVDPKTKVKTPMSQGQIVALDKVYSTDFKEASDAYSKLSKEAADAEGSEKTELESQMQAAAQLLGEASDNLGRLNTARQALYPNQAQSQPSTSVDIPVGSATIPAGAQKAKNPKTGEIVYSTDKGKTWFKQAPSPQTNTPSIINQPLGQIVGNAVVGGLNRLGAANTSNDTSGVQQSLFQQSASQK